MIPEYKPPANTVRQWDRAMVEVSKSIRSDLDEIVLFSEVGLPWKRAGLRFKPVTFKEAIKRIEARRNYETRWSANPRLKYLYMNQSTLLNTRHQHFNRHFPSVFDEPKITSAFRKTAKRIGQRATKDQAEEVCWLLDDIGERLAWERLHADAIEEEFHELEFQVLLAGHLPAGVEGKDWRTCKILYC
jgi:hypothetical protein